MGISLSHASEPIQLKYLKMLGQIDVKQKGYAAKRLWVKCVTLIFYLTRNLDL